MWASAAAIEILEDAFDRGRFYNGEEARLAAGLRGRVRAVALARRIQAVDCAPHVVPLRDLDAVGEDLDGEWVVGDLLSIRIQLGGGRERSRSHPLYGVPWTGRMGREDKY